MSYNSLTPEQQNALLSDPRVQDAVKSAGQDALNDPKVQQQILDTCKEKFPEYASAAANQVKEWASDPVVQERAKAYATLGLSYLGDAGNQFMKQIEQGPAGVRLLTFLTSCASAALSVMDLISIMTIFGHMITYIVAGYQFIFAMTTILFEVPQDWHTKVQEKTGFPIDTYQNLLIENCKFLTLNGGRGLFYIFQGTLWLAFASFTEFLELGVGCALCFMGLLHVLMHFNIMPQSVATKMRQGYQQVKSAATGSSADGASAPLNP